MYRVKEDLVFSPGETYIRKHHVSIVPIEHHVSKIKPYTIFLPLTNSYFILISLTTLIALGLSYLPWIIFFVVTLGFLGILVKGLLQFHYGFLKVKKLSLKKPLQEKFISVHVPACNEPPELLKNTLLKLSQQNYSNYEVIIIDNNTKDPSVWKPIASYCKKLGKKFRFYHVEDLKGFKAGALNYIKDKINPKTEYIAVVDADYEVTKNFLHEANKYFSDEKIGFIQFPQAYRNVTKNNVGLNLEYQHFFLTYMNMANYFNCVTAVGTLSVFRIEALRKVGFFNNNSITEDCDIGVRLNRVGYSGLYVPKIVGRGLMPYDLASYKKQKTRWGIGNLQILKNNFFAILIDKNMTLGQKVGLLSQLTAWINFTFFPILIILITSVLRTINYQYYPIMHFIVFFSATSLVIFLILEFLSFYTTFKRINSFSQIIRAFAIHVGLTGMYSFAFIKIFNRTCFVFKRTNKFLHLNATGVIKNAFIEILIGLGSFLLSLYQFLQANYTYAGALFLLSSIYLLILYVNQELVFTRKASEYLLETEKTHKLL